MEEAEPEDVPENPVVAELSKGAIKPYESVLPKPVVQAFGHLIDMILIAHPIGSDLVARLTPGPSAEPRPAPTASQKGFQAFAAVSVLRKTLAHIRDLAPPEERAKFFWCPDGSFQVAAAFLNYFCTSDNASALGDREARFLGQDFTDAVVAALFLGLMRDLEDHPTLPRDWGDTGKELAAQMPVTRVLLRDALGLLSARERDFLSQYHACGWATDQMERQYHVTAPVVNNRCIQVMLHLGSALRGRLERGILSADKPS
jgi:hypothetical protein